jgi:DNA-binding CsgD family transcriptional regulator
MENNQLREQIKEKETNAPVVQEKYNISNQIFTPDNHASFDENQIQYFLNGVDNLTPTERKIYDAYILRATTKEIRESMNITENTLKFHNKNIYSKLGVSSRKELMEIYKYIVSINKI